MESSGLILMEKNKENGYFEREIGTYSITNNLNLIESIYMINKDEKSIIYLKLTTDRDVEDWEFSAILDYYDDEILKDAVLSFEEVEDAYNPTWKVTFEFIDSQEGMQIKLEDILNKHKNELDEVYNEIKDRKEEYQ